MAFQLNPVLIEQLTEETINYLGLAFYIIVVFVVGYFMGLVVSSAFKRLLLIQELENALVRYGAMTTKLWGSIVRFLSQYLKWFVTMLVLTTTEIAFLEDVAGFLGDLFWFILLTVAGLLIGGIIFRVVKNALDSLGLEDWLTQHKVDGAFGGLTLSDIISGILKWYVVLLFANEGTVKLKLPIISTFIAELVTYIPEALSGIVIVILSLLIARFTSERIRERKISYRESFALVVESIITFFGIVLALPILIQNVDVTILTDSFRILIAGVALAVGIAGGLGLKDHIAQTAQRI